MLFRDDQKLVRERVYYYCYLQVGHERQDHDWGDQQLRQPNDLKLDLQAYESW